MAHKKGVGSSKNGRESESKRLGVKISAVNLLKLVTLSNVNVVQFTTQVKTLVWVKTTLFTLLLMAQ
jgi:ribosomal protein L27